MSKSTKSGQIKFVVSINLTLVALLTLFGIFPIFFPVSVAQAYACGGVPNPASNVTANPAISSEATGIAAINNARALEGLGPLALPADYYTRTPAERVLTLFSLERVSRGLTAFSQNDPLLAQVALNHSQVLIDFGLFAHDDAVDGNFSVRVSTAPGVNGHWNGLGEIIVGSPYTAYDVYIWNYADSSSSWGHRQNIFGCYTHVGIGLTSGAGGNMDTTDFLLSSSGSPYQPVALGAVDTTKPALSVNPPSFNSAVSSSLTVSAISTDNVALRHVAFFLDNNFAGTTVPAGTASGSTYTYNFANVSAGNHTLTVVAVDTTNNYTRVNVPISDLALIPPTPTNLIASSTSTQINLSWAYSSSNIDGFRIERKTGSAGTYSQIATVGPTIRAYADTTVSPCTTYYYRIIAYKTTNNSSYSNEVSASLLLVPGSGSTYAQNYMDAYNRAGGATGMGQPTDCVRLWPTSTGLYWQSFSGGSTPGNIFHDQAGGANPASIRAFVIPQSLLTPYLSVFLADSTIGAPTSDVFTNSSNQLQVSFAGGYFIWNGSSWQRNNWPTSFTGWKAQYFNNANLWSGPTLVRDEVGSGSGVSTLNFSYLSWPAYVAPMPNQGLTFADNWSARWERNYNFAAGNYKFTLCGDDGVRLYLDGLMVINQWQVQNLTCYDYSKTYLSPTNVSIKIEYYQGNGGQAITFSVTALVPMVVRLADDRGDALDSGAIGTLSYALTQATDGQEITFELPNGLNIVNVTGKLPDVKPGVKIRGVCTNGQPGIIINGTGISTAVDGLILKGRNRLDGLKITKFKGRQIATNGVNNQIVCTEAIK